MTTEQPPVKETALLYARTAGEAFADQAAFFRSLPPDAWDGPTGCARWTMRDLVGHVVGEAVWFAHLVREVTADEPPLPKHLWEELKQLPPDQIADRMDAAARELPANVEAATPEQLRRDADLGWTVMPLWQGLGIGLQEAVVHNWDGRIGRDPDATIRTAWAKILASRMAAFAPRVARSNAARQFPGRYLLDVGDGIGPIMIVAGPDGVHVEPGNTDNPDVTLHLTADQYVRLIDGRLPLKDSIARGRVQVEGDTATAEALNQIFLGIAN